MAEAAFLLVDKGRGPTSHDVVAAVRRLSGQRRVGHGGTLDPMATGVLVLALGRATRLLRFVQELPKEYQARAVFGVATDSLDADGAVLDREPMPVSQEEVEAVLPRFRGRIAQVPPMVSAVRVEGERLYELARRGEEVEREARPVVVDELEVTDFAPGEYPEVAFRVICGKGTYVRVLVDDVARALGGRAHLVELRRVRVGSLRESEAFEFEELSELAEAGAWEKALLTPAEGLRDLPAVVVAEETARAVRHGMVFGRGSLPAPEDGPFRVLDGQGRLLAVYRVAGPRLGPEVVLG